MTAAEPWPRYFVLVVDGRPYCRPTHPDTPAVYHHEDHATEQGESLLRLGRAVSVTVECYDEAFAFLETRWVKAPLQHPLAS